MKVYPRLEARLVQLEAFGEIDYLKIEAINGVRIKIINVTWPLWLIGCSVFQSLKKCFQLSPLLLVVKRYIPLYISRFMRFFFRPLPQTCLEKWCLQWVDRSAWVTSTTRELTQSSTNHPGRSTIRPWPTLLQVTKNLEIHCSILKVFQEIFQFFPFVKIAPDHPFKMTSW